MQSEAEFFLATGLETVSSDHAVPVYEKTWFTSSTSLPFICSLALVQISVV